MRWLVVLALAACAHEPPVRKTRAPIQWTDSEGRPLRDNSRTTESIRYREAHRQGEAVQESHVPHLRCNDGSLAPNCAPNGVAGDCCVNQGGVYRDGWGNVVYE